MVMCAGCGLKAVRSGSDLVRYLEDKENGYTREVDAGRVTYSVQLATPQYMAAKEYADSSEADAGFRQRARELEGYLFFLIRIQPESVDKTDADRMVRYYSGAAQGDLTLNYGGKVLNAASYHFEDNFSLSPYNTIVVAFETGSKPEDAALLFNDRYANNPLVRASFSARQLSEIPSLK